jgi:outer membrane protein assembly factor BamB
LFIFTAGASAEPASQPAGQGSTDWPQWRGPTRDGIAPAGPKLLDTWPAEGPKLLWKSEPIPSGPDGGAGSVVVAGEKVFLFASIRRDASSDPQRIQAVLKQVLGDMGWLEGVPDALAKKIEEERLSDKRAKTAGGNPLKGYLREFIATLEPETAKKYGGWVSTRLVGGRGTIGWEALGKLAGLQDKSFPTIDAFNKAAELAAAAEAGAAQKLATAMKAKLFNYTDSVFCWEAATGKELWKNEIPTWRRGQEDMGNWGASGTPSIVGDRCYVQGGAGLYCLSVKEGKVLWQTKTAFSHSSPLVAGGKVFVCSSTADVGHGQMPLTAYSAETGQTIWTQPKLASDEGTSAVLWSQAGKQYLLCNAVGYWTGMKGPGLFCLDPEKGEIIWRLPEVGGGASSSSPALCGDLAVVDGGRGTQAVQLAPQGGTLLWTTPPSIWRAPSALVYQGHAYLVNSSFMRCLDLKTGAIKWERKEVNNHYASPILADGKIICPTGGRDHNYYILLQATPEKFEELGSLGKVPNGKHIGACCTSPALADGKLYLRLENGVACYDLTEAGNKPIATSSSDRP